MLEQMLAGAFFLFMLVSLVACSVWVVGSWVATGYKRRSLPGRRSVLSGLAVLGVLTLGLGLSSLFVFWSNPFNRAWFDQQVWLSAKGDQDNPRGPMANDLLRRHLKKGTTREAVLQLLGPSDDTEAYLGKPMVFTTGYEGTRQILRYYLGAWSGMRIDGDYLDIAFDGSGRLLGAWVWQS